MKNAIIIHGWFDLDEINDPKYPTPSNANWFPWLSKQLMIRGIHTVSVEMPINEYPVYNNWKKEFERYDVGPETTLVGHSCGGGFIVRWLSENPDVRVGKVVLVAPWMGIKFNKDFDESFFDFTIDPKISERTNGLTILNSSNDFAAIQESVKILTDKLQDIKLIELKNKGHFTFDEMGTEEFPELLEEILL